VNNVLVQIAWKGALILAAGFAASFLLSRASSALRHYLWTTVFAALLILPAAISLTPKWNLPAARPDLGPGAQVTATTSVVATRSSVPRRPATNPLPWIYAAGAIAVAIRFIAGAVRTRRLLAGSRPVTRYGLPRTVRVLESPNAPVPLVWGIFRPVIVLPAASRSWSGDRLRTVLLHELIHVQRRDLLAQVLAQAACCLHWFQPLAWIAARELRRERERACDDAVLHRGINAPEYAGHLVDLVRGLTIEAPAMAEASDFEGRVRALLDRGRNRAPLTRSLALGGAALALALILPVASITSFAQSGRGALAGVVADPSGARVPGAEVRIFNKDGSNQETAIANEAGEYVFLSIPTGSYDVEVRARGFKIRKQSATVAAGEAARADAFLELGEATETVKVVGSGKATASPRAATPQRIPIGGNVQPMRLIRQPRPEYPADLQQQGIAGSVIIRGVVGTDGQLLNPKVVNTEIHPALAQAALNAVATWLYDPAKLNGQPVETATTITVTFELNQ
jgi:TonB family protein